MFFKIALFLLTGLNALFAMPAQAADLERSQQPNTPVVQAVLFWEQGCPNCEKVMNEFLPAFQTAQGEQFTLEMIEVVSIEDVNRLYQVGAAYGLSKDQIGVPLMVVGDYVLVGADQIPAELPQLVADYLAEGGITTVLRELPQESALAAETVKDDGMWLAWLTMLVMAAGIALTGWQVWRSFDGAADLHFPAWVDWLTPILSVVGIGVAIYLTFIETTKAQAICGPVGDCNAVQNSKYALLFGVLPVGVLGLLGYLGILAAWLAQRLRSGALATYAPVAILGMTIFGTVFSIYLTYLEIFVIQAVCIWCISSAWIMTILMTLSLPAAMRWLAAAEEETP